jgi:cytochrome c1
MLTNHEPDRNIEDLSDAEIYAVIRYLESAETSTDEQNDDNGVVTCVCLYIALLGCLAFVWLYSSDPVSSDA